MNKLKTSKEIYKELLKKDFSPEQLLAITYLFENQKKEVIKWVKNRREIKQPITESTFMLFSNITEEDLK